MTTAASPRPRSTTTRPPPPPSPCCVGRSRGSPPAWSLSACCPTTAAATSATPGATPAPNSGSHPSAPGPTDRRPTARSCLVPGLIDTVEPRTTCMGAPRKIRTSTSAGLLEGPQRNCQRAPPGHGQGSAGPRARVRRAAGKGPPGRGQGSGHGQSPQGARARAAGSKARLQRLGPKPMGVRGRGLNVAPDQHPPRHAHDRTHLIPRVAKARVALGHATLSRRGTPVQSRGSRLRWADANGSALLARAARNGQTVTRGERSAAT
jgi:hypothetical protein